MKDCDDDADPRPLRVPLGLPSHPAVPPQKPPGDSPPGTEIMSFTIVPERPQDAALLSPLLDRTFGFDRIRQTEVGGASGRERVCQHVELTGVAVSLKKKEELKIIIK